MSRSLKIESSGRINQTDENSFLPDQGLTFGNFSAEEFEKLFSQNEVSNSAVEFLCDTLNATKYWIEEENKSTFSYLEDASTKNSKKINEEEKSSINSQLNGSYKTGNAVKRPATTSWASLFKESSALVENGVLNGSEANPAGLLTIQQEQEEEIKERENQNNLSSVSLISMTNDKRALSLAEKVSKLTPNYDRHHLQLRGLINRGNWCYINTTLQALLGISAISHFYKSLKDYVKTDSKSTSTPLNDSLIKFFNEFEPINPKISIKKQTEDLRAGTAFEPRFIYDVLPVLKTTLSEKGRQEDAEEFLSFLLNGIHDELVDLRKHVLKTPIINGQLCSNTNLEDFNSENGSDEDSWEHVGKNNKASTLRKAIIEDSHIKHVFGGVIRSSVFQKGKKESTTLQPFFTLQLDIKDDNIWSLKDALESYFVQENLHGFTCSATNTEVEAFRRISLEELPHVFIFHLKYFVFDREGGCQKLHKPLDIPANLEISKDILSSSAKSRNAASRNYKLCAVVYHHGKHAAGGHYTAAVHHGNPFGWINFDDNNIKPVNVNQVTKYNRGCVPYLLFYERLQSR